MSTLEKLFMQVFDRKQWIGEQVRQQLDSYEQSLAFNLVGSGRGLPSWLFDDGVEPRSDAPVLDYSNRTELNGKQIITDLLYPSSQVTTPANHNTVSAIPSYKPTQSFLQDSHFTGACFSDNHIQNLQTNEEITSTSLEECHEEQSHMEPDMTYIGAFSTIQRSRSRQKDIAKRLSEKEAPSDTKADIFDKELVETSNQGREGDGKEGKQGETVQSSDRQIMNRELTETLDCVETGVIGPREEPQIRVELVETSNQGREGDGKEGKQGEKDLSSPVGESCRIRDGKERNEVEMLESSASRLINPEPTQTLNCTETSAVESKGLVSSLALAGFGNNLDSVVENHDEARVVEEMIEGVETLGKITVQEPTCPSNCMENDSVELKRPSFDEPRRDRPSFISAEEDFLSPERLGQGGLRETEAVLHARNSHSPDGIRGGDGEERNEEIGALVKGLDPDVANPKLTEPSVGKVCDVREVEVPFYARDSYSPTGDVTGYNNEATEMNEPMVGQMDIIMSPHLSQSMGVVGKEVFGLSYKRKSSVTSSFHEATSRQSTSLSEANFGSCQSIQTNPDDDVGPLVKSGEGIKRLISGGRYFLRSSASQEKSNASVLLDGMHSGEAQFHVNVNSWPKRGRMEAFSNSVLATSPSPRKRRELPKVICGPVEEDESEASVLVPEEYNRVPSRSSSSADKGKASVSPTEPNIGSPCFDANHFSISPKEGDIANDSKYVLEIDVGTSWKHDDGCFIDQVDTRPELEAFCMGTSSGSEGETRNTPEPVPLRRERASLLKQLSCNLATPKSCFSAKHKPGNLSNLYKSVPTGLFDFMQTGDRKQLSASASYSSYEPGPFGCAGFKMGLSTSGNSGRGSRPPLTPPPAEKFSYSGIRSSGKTPPLYPDLTCFRIDEDAAEDDVPNDNNALEPQDLSTVLEESTLPSVNDSKNLPEDDDPNYQSCLRDVTAVYENTETWVAIPEKPKQSAAASLSKRDLGRNASESMRSGLATVDAIRKGQERSVGTVSSKPSNIVSDVTSFLPLIKQKQQPVTKKREVRVPALEAAEANKRLEEKRRNERELQKAAMKAEREKLNQEKALKKKQEEEQRKKEADMAAKKRQKEEREKKEKDKEKEKKRKFIEIDRQTQKEEPTKKEQPKRTRLVREEKELQRNVTDVKCGKEDAFVRPREMGFSIINVDDSVEAPELPRIAEKSYEMSPFKDSDEEGDDLDEVEEDKIRRKKFIPEWARKEFLEAFLQSKKYLNPEIVFSRKRSFDLTKVLKPLIPKQQF